MSSYIRTTVHPITSKPEQAEWLDDFFGQHSYGVRFPSDGRVFKADEYDWHEVNDTKVMVGSLKTNHITVRSTEVGERIKFPKDEPEITVEDGLDGKKTITTKYPDGRQDVRIEVTRLDIENRTDEDTKAEAVIIGAMAKKIVRVVVLHKPTNEFTSFDSPFSEVRGRAAQVIEAFERKFPAKVLQNSELEVKDQFAIIEYDADQIRVSTL